MLSWIGALLQRLYEVYDTSNDPTQEYAIVLIDEIDAHMHPIWQQFLVHKLRENFPNIQFIATTHSPLIVGGLEPANVLRFVRDENGKVGLLTVSAKMLVGRTDQILTTELFDLSSTLDVITQKDMKIYKNLLSKGERTQEEEEEYINLRERLKLRIPPPDETPIERTARQFLRDLLLKQPNTKYFEIQEEILANAENYLAEVERRRKEKI